MARLGTLCLQYIGNGARVAAAAAGSASQSLRDGGERVASAGVSGMDVDGRDDDGGAGNQRLTAVQSESPVSTVGFVEAMRILAIITSCKEWMERGLAQSRDGDEARVLCRRLLVSLALGILVLREDQHLKAAATAINLGIGLGVRGSSQQANEDPPSTKLGNSRNLGEASTRDAGGRVCLVVRTSNADILNGRWTRRPRLFGVLRMHWDVAAAAAAVEIGLAMEEGGDNVRAAIRLLCDVSLEALGMNTDGAVSSAVASREGGTKRPAASSASEDASRQKIAVAMGEGDTVVTPKGAPARTPSDYQPRGLYKVEILEAFACTILPSPKLLEHPHRALLIDPMLSGDARAWWELVTVAGEAVGTRDRETGLHVDGAVGRRRDVAWTVANLLRVSLLRWGERERVWTLEQYHFSRRTTLFVRFINDVLIT